MNQANRTIRVLNRAIILGIALVGLTETSTNGQTIAVIQTLRAVPSLNNSSINEKHGSPTAFSAIVGTDWPQLQNNPQHTGYSPENLNLPISNVWARGFAPERLYPQVQPIVVAGRLYIGTEMGTLYSFDATNGNLIWKYPVDGQPRIGPILGTAGVENGVLFFGSMDGSIYALDANAPANSPRLLWKFSSNQRAGFSSSVVLAEGKVFIPSRAGVFYALNQTDGSVAWQTNLGVPVFMSPAYDNGMIFVGAMNMKLYALSSLNGSVVWQTKDNEIRGSAFKDYWPVVYNRYVFIRPMKVYGDVTVTPGIAQLTGLLPQSELDKQGQLLTSGGYNPPNQDLFVFDKNTGQQVVMPHYAAMSMDSAVCPPAVDGDGLLIEPILWAAGSNGSSGWGRLNISSNRIVEALWDGSQATGNLDESICVSAVGRLVLIMHTQEGNAQFTGVWHLDQRKSTLLSQYEVEQYFWSNTQGAGTTPASVSNGYIYHTSQNTLNARKAR